MVVVEYNDLEGDGNLQGPQLLSLVPPPPLLILIFFSSCDDMKKGIRPKITSHKTVVCVSCR